MAANSHDLITIHRDLAKNSEAIEALRRENEYVKDRQQQILSELSAISKSLQEWKGSTKTIVGFAAAVAGILSSVVAYWLTVGTNKLLGG